MEGRGSEFICFLVQRGIVTNMSSQDASRTIDRVSKHLDYDESLPPSSSVNAVAIESIRIRLVRDLPDYVSGISLDATNTLLMCRNNIHVIASLNDMKGEDKVLQEDILQRSISGDSTV